ncbi:MAG: CpaF family protein [Clostridia bacterium]|nr:CpaF family protein [Clostridia bacterium]
MGNALDYVYEMGKRPNANTNNERSVSNRKIVKKEYVDILEFIRKEISTNHANELAEVISDASGQTVLKNLIKQYINSNNFMCSDIENFESLVNKIFEDMAGFGLLTQYIYDKDVEEINITAWNNIEVLSPNYKGGLKKLDETFASPQQAIDIVQKMCACGGIRLDESQPVKDSYIFKGTRCSAIMYPAVDKETGVSASIRRQKKRAITKKKLLDENSAIAEELDFISMCINCGVSVGYTGGTGSGKTADMGIVLRDIPYNKRIYSIEDSRELDLIATDDNGKVLNRVVHTVTRPHEDTKSNVDAELLLKEALRQHPDIIVPAEMRGAEAWTAVNAGLTGHTIVTSVHANSAEEAYERIFMLCLEKNANLTEKMLMTQIIKAFPIMVFKKQLPDGSRKIMSVVEGLDYNEGRVRYNTIFRFQKTRQYVDNDGELRIEGHHKRMGCISDILALKLYENGAEVDTILQYAKVGWNAETTYAALEGGDSENAIL